MCRFIDKDSHFTTKKLRVKTELENSFNAKDLGTILQNLPRIPEDACACESKTKSPREQ